MRRFSILIVLCAGTLLARLPVQAQDRKSGHESAAAAIRKLGGDVKLDSTKPDKPTEVVLTGADKFDECLSYLKELNNLQTCNL